MSSESIAVQAVARSREKITATLWHAEYTSASEKTLKRTTAWYLDGLATIQIQKTDLVLAVAKAQGASINPMKWDSFLPS